MVVMDYKIIDSVFGIMDDFDQFIQDIKNNNSMKYLKYILCVQMDFFCVVRQLMGDNYIYFVEVR